MKYSKGFTLIEMVVVIAVLGILAAVALPRFMNATKDAHRAAVSGVGGALSSAVVLVRAQWEINRNKGTTSAPGTNVIGFGDDSVDVNTKGWPIGTADKLDCVALWNALLQGSAPSVALSAGAGVDYVAPAPATDGKVCVYTYQPDGANDTITYNSDDGTVKTAFTE